MKLLLGCDVAEFTSTFFPGQCVDSYRKFPGRHLHQNSSPYQKLDQRQKLIEYQDFTKRLQVGLQPSMSSLLVEEYWEESLIIIQILYQILDFPPQKDITFLYQEA